MLACKPCCGPRFPELRNIINVNQNVCLVALMRLQEGWRKCVLLYFCASRKTSKQSLSLLFFEKRVIACECHKGVILTERVVLELSSLPVDAHEGSRNPIRHLIRPFGTSSANADHVLLELGKDIVVKLLLDCSLQRHGKRGGCQERCLREDARMAVMIEFRPLSLWRARRIGR